MTNKDKGNALMDSFLDGLGPDEIKALFVEASKEGAKQAATEWMDRQFATVGKWTVRGIASMAIAGLVYLFIVFHGFGTVSK